MSAVTKYIEVLQGDIAELFKKKVTGKWLHDIRVKIKQLKALWAIHPIGQGIKFRKQFPGTIHLFKTAAKARDLQVTLRYLKTLPAFSHHQALEKKLKANIEVRVKQVNSLLKKYRQNQKVGLECEEYLTYFKIASSFLLKENKKKFKEQTGHQIMELLHADSHAIHSIRKYIKFRIFHEEAFHGKNYIGKHYEQTLMHIQHKLGIWHDWYNVVQWMRKQMVNKPKNRYMNLYEQAKRKESLLIREALKEIQLKSKELVAKNKHIA